MTSPFDQAEPAATGRLNGPPRIILLDDVPEVRQYIRTIIQAQFADVEFLECENGDEAWAMLQSSPPDLLITDHSHPGLRGEEILKRLAAAHSQLPVLLVSAFHPGLESLRETHPAHSLAPRGFLTKPFTVEALQAEIERLIVGRAGGA
jgi:two-component system, NtrC family, nitrogen regulation response regulator GlnG